MYFLSTHLIIAFPREFVEKAVILLVNRFIPLNPKDIRDWSEDPEEWANTEDKENEHWEYQLRVSYIRYPLASFPYLIVD